jgi:hypothetical protein
MDHHQGIHVAKSPVTECPGQGADHLKAVALPAADPGGVGAHHEGERHQAKPEPPCCVQGVLGHHVAGIGHQRAAGIDSHHHRLALLHPRHLSLGLGDRWIVGADLQGEGGQRQRQVAIPSHGLVQRASGFQHRQVSTPCPGAVASAPKCRRRSC